MWASAKQKWRPAAFKMVQEGRQCAVLVPTTILAQQHYNTFCQRMKEYPINIGLLSRFRTRAEQKKTLEDLKARDVWILHWYTSVIV